MGVFKITKKHLEKHPELEEYDIGYYGVKVSDREVLIYDSEIVAKKAFIYFQKLFRKSKSK